MLFKNTDPATRELVMGCLPLLAAAAITAALAAALWWSLK
jgi:hypothetical protein